MKKHIFEELPATKHTQAPQQNSGGNQKTQSGGPGAAKPDNDSGRTVEGDVDKQVRQAIYDIRYRARREGISLEQAYSQYISNSNLPQEAKMRIREVLFPKGDAGGKEETKECYTYSGIDMATTSVSNALYKVFVENNEVDYTEEEMIKFFEEKIKTADEKEYSVKVMDTESGVTYYRKATLKKIRELEKNPRIKVTYDEYGTLSGQNYEGEDEKKKDEKEVKEALDPVGKEDDDVNNDGKVDDTDGYLKSRRGAIAKAIAKRRGKKKVAEEFIGEVTMDQIDPSLEKAPLDVMVGKNKVKVANHNSKDKYGIPIMENSMEKFLKMARNRISGNCPKCGKCPCECDTRDRATEMNVVKNKLRSMGKNVVAATSNDTEKSYDKLATASFIKMDPETGRMKPVGLFGESMIMVADSLIEEGYDEYEIFYAIDNLNEEQMQELEEGLGSLLKTAGGKLLKSGVGKKALQKAKNVVKNVVGKGNKGGKSPIAQRAGEVVRDQRAGVSGTADELNLMQRDVEALSSSLKKLKDPTRGDAIAAAGRVERDVKRAAAMTPARTSSKPYGQAIDRSVSDQGKISFEVPKQSSIVRPPSYKEMMAKRSKEFAGKTEAEKQEIFNQYLKRWKQNNK